MCWFISVYIIRWIFFTARDIPVNSATNVCDVIDLKISRHSKFQASAGIYNVDLMAFKYIFHFYVLYQRKM
jgi:hypothetical protein